MKGDGLAFGDVAPRQTPVPLLLPPAAQVAFKGYHLLEHQFHATEGKVSVQVRAGGVQVLAAALAVVEEALRFFPAGVAVLYAQFAVALQPGFHPSETTSFEEVMIESSTGLEAVGMKVEIAGLYASVALGDAWFLAGITPERDFTIL